MSEFIVKSYFTRPDGQEDIRRIAFTSKDEATHENVAKRTSELYEIPLECVKLFWKDNDGDVVTLANAEEFATVVKAARDDLLKVVVKVVVPQKPVDPTLHVGITCDSCDKPVHNIRFKCLTCPDYDLCAECETKHEHEDHLMLKIPKPNMPGVGPLVMLSRAFRHCNDMGQKGKEGFNSAMGQMPNPQDYVDMEAIGRQTIDMLKSMGINADYMIEQGKSGGPFGPFGPFGQTGPFGQSGPFGQTGPFGQSGPFPGCGQRPCKRPCGPNNAAASAAMEKRVAETLEHLRAMGFTDDNDNLTNLVKQKNGDLYAVLDVLKSQQQPTEKN